VAQNLLSTPTDFSYVGSCKVGVLLSYSCKEPTGTDLPLFFYYKYLYWKRGGVFFSSMGGDCINNNILSTQEQGQEDTTL
jgi:hypothetical protein